MDNHIRTGISYMYEPAFNRAILPLLEQGEVDALEWSFDTVKDYKLMPAWLQQLLKEYGDAGRLYGHGVYYSVFAGAWLPRHHSWLQNLESLLKKFSFSHISEHFGFMTSGNAHAGAPLPVPLSPATLELGVRRLQHLAALTGIPVGMENLAFCFSLKDMQEQGKFLEELVMPVNGFVLLDLHNIYCQAMNFGMDAKDIIQTYPLHLVKEIHVSGGSWEDSVYSDRPVRRDTHDHAIPEAVLALLEYALPLCPRTDLVTVERLGDTLKDEQDEALFRDEFLHVKDLVRKAPRGMAGQWPAGIIPAAVTDELLLHNPALQEQQVHILEVLKQAPDAPAAHEALLKDPCIDHTLWQTQDWQLPMIETAILLGKKWGIETGA